MTCFCFFNDTATTEIYTLSLHDALPISLRLVEAELELQAAGVLVPDRVAVVRAHRARKSDACVRRRCGQQQRCEDRKSTRLNSSHANISYDVFCLKKKHTSQIHTLQYFI